MTRTTANPSLLHLLTGALMALTLLWPGTAVTEPRSLVVLDFGIIDTTMGETSYHPHDPADEHRLTRTAQVLREALANHPDYRLVDHAALDDTIADATAGRHLHRCPSCQIAVAEALGAEVILAGSVRKISNLILQMSLELHDVARNERITGGHVNIRGNTDVSWERGAQSLLRNQLHLLEE